MLGLGVLALLLLNQPFWCASYPEDVDAFGAYRGACYGALIRHDEAIPARS